MKRKVAILLSLILLLSSVGVSAAQYEVKKGDVLWKIARMYDTEYQNLAKHNKLKNPHLIFPGQKLEIPEVKKVEEAKSTVKDIVVLGTADLHGRIYPYDYAQDSPDADAGLAKISTLVKEERKSHPNLLLVDAGDTVQDNSADLFNDLPVHPMIQCLNTLKADVWALGNHEFNYGLDFLNKNIKGFEGAVLATNIYKKGTKERYVDAYKIFEVEGVKVAVIGLVTPHIPIWEASTPKNFEGLEFMKTLESLGLTIKELEGKYDVLVGVFHLDPEGEYNQAGVDKVAETYPEFDLIVGGHSHKLFSKELNGVALIEPGRYGQALAKAEIKVEVKPDGSKKVLGVKTENLSTKEVESDQAILEQFKFVHDKSVADANMIVGEVVEDYIKRVDYITGEAKVTTMPTAQVEDTALLDLINEVQKAYTKADVSSAAAFRPDMNLRKGDFKKKNAADIYKYPNTLVGVKITGENLKKYMEWSASYYNTYKPGDVTVSFNKDIRGYNYDMFTGVNYKIDISKEAGSRITDASIDGKPIVDDKLYKLAVNNYRLGTLLKLGFVKKEDKYYDSYEEFQDNGRIRTLIGEYIKKTYDGKFIPKVDNNWEIIGAPDLKHPRREEVYKLLKDGTIVIPMSEDKRTRNIKSINILELIDEGIIPAK